MCRKTVKNTLEFHPAWKLFVNTKWKSLVGKQRVASEEEENKLQQSRGCLLYLILVEEYELDSFPQVGRACFLNIYFCPCVLPMPVFAHLFMSGLQYFSCRSATIQSPFCVSRPSVQSDF